MGLVRRGKRTFTKVTWLSDAFENVSSGIRERWKRTHVLVHLFFCCVLLSINECLFRISLMGSIRNLFFFWMLEVFLEIN